MVNLGLSRKKMMGKVDDLLSELSSRHHVQFTAYCAVNGLKMKDVLTELVTGYLKDNGAL